MPRVLVTGATGFIGNYVVEELLRRSVPVVASSRDIKKAERFHWFNEVEYAALDLSALDKQANYFEYFSLPEIVIHLAWEGLPDYKSLFHFEDNLPRHYWFLKNLVENGCEDITVAGTCFEYGMKEGEMSEEMFAEPDNPYGLAKFALYNFLKQLQKKRSFHLKWARLFYMYGEGQNPRSLFPQLDKALKEGEEVFNMSGGEQVRDFLRVEQVAAFIVDIALQQNVEDVINCCSGNPVKVKDLVADYIRARNKTIRLNLGYYPYPDYEPMSFWGSNKKLQTILTNE